MITRLIPKTTFRALAVQFTGDNWIEILEFCKFAYRASDTLYIRYNCITQEINQDDWIVKLDNDTFIPITDDIKRLIFK